MCDAKSAGGGFSPPALFRRKEAVMRRAPQWLLPVSAVFLLAGCSSTLRLSNENRPAYLAELRAQYLASNPAAPYRTHVSRGEVVKGMDTIGVLASWGHPERRVREGMDAEHWLYIDEDKDSGDRISYALVFHRGILDEWSMSRENSGMRAVQTSPAAKTTPAEKPKGKPVPEN
jgi:hypothetical protein